MRATRLQKLLALSWADRRMLLRACTLLVRAHFTMPRTQFRPDPITALAAPTPQQVQQGHHIARIVSMAAAACPLPVACLHRSVVLWRLLSQRHIPCRLRIGARSTTGPFGAHAWVECAGQALQEVPDLPERFQAFGPALVPVQTP